MTSPLPKIDLVGRVSPSLSGVTEVPSARRKRWQSATGPGESACRAGRLTNQAMDSGMPTTRVRKPPGAGQAKIPSTLIPTLAGVVLGTFWDDFPFAVHPK